LNGWFDVVEYYFAKRWDEPRVPDALYGAISRVLGDKFTPKIVHPVERDSKEIALLMVVETDEAVLVRFEPPSTTKISFLGSLAGGMYTETVRVVDEGGYEIEGVFNHERLGERPLRVRGDPPPSNSAYFRHADQAALDRTERLRQTFRWSTELKHPRPGRT